MRRRTLLGTMAGFSLASLTGCSSDDGSGDGSNDGGDGGDGAAEQDEVAVGPGGSLTYEPETIVVSPGTTVTWTFESATHNVSCNPEHHDAASLPDDAEPFASYEGDERFATNEEGETFEHTFEVEGTYDYVCVPHAGSGMVGTVEVE